MPRQIEWLLRVPQIRAELESLSSPVVDRAMVEKLFSLRRRRAIQLMHRFGGFLSGKTFLIERTVLLGGLQAIEAGEEFSLEDRRRERLSAQLDQVRRRAAASRVTIQVQPQVFDTRLTSLPPGVHLTPGRLTLEFASPQELIERLFSLSQALVNDFDHLEPMLRL